MIMQCEFSKADAPFLIVSVVNIEVDDADAEMIENEPSMLNGEKLICVSAIPLRRS